MLRFNQKLITLEQQERQKKESVELLKKQMEAQMQELQEIEDKADAERLQDENWLKTKWSVFEKQFAGLFNGTRYKFTAHLSENSKFIETKNQGGEIMGRYGKDASGLKFKPLEVTIPAISKQEDLDYSLRKQQIYNLMENTFK